MEKELRKVIIVGGGLGGLATAALLAQDGFSVTIYEKTQTLGGRALCKKVAGYWLDSGFHSLRKADRCPAATVLKRLGKHIEFATKYSDGVVPKTYHNGRLVDSPLSLGQLLLRYPLLTLVQKIRMMVLIQKIKKMPLEILDQMTIAQLLQATKIRDKTIIAHIKQMIAIAYYCEPDLNKISAGELARYLAEWPYDVGFPKGGWKQITDKLQESVLENGGVIRTGKEVKGVLITNGSEEEKEGEGGGDSGINTGRATGVIFNDGRKEEADLIILNTPLKEVLNLVIEKYIPQKLSQLIGNGMETSAGIVIDFSVGTEVIGGKPDSIITLDPCMIFRVNSKYDSSIAPPGHHLLSAWMPIDNTRIKDRNYVDCKIEELEHNMYKVFSLGDSTSNNNTIKVIRKMVFENAIGFYPSPSMTRSKRPSVSVPTVKNLYLVGDAMNTEGIGGTSDIAFTSAIECHNAILSNIQELRLNAQADNRAFGDQ
jgi:phytoene dehydrogenase-like protein